MGPHPVDREPVAEREVFRAAENGAAALRKLGFKHRLSGELQQKHPQLRLGQFPAG